MNTSYEKIYGIFLSKITDYDLASLSDDELEEYCYNIFVSAMTKIHSFDQNDLSDRDDVKERFNSELTDVEIEIITSQMVIEWVDRKLNTTQLLHMYVGTKDESMASQANHMKTLIELKEKQRSIISSMMRDAKYRKWVEEGLQ